MPYFMTCGYLLYLLILDYLIQETKLVAVNYFCYNKI